MLNKLGKFDNGGESKANAAGHTSPVCAIAHMHTMYAQRTARRLPCLFEINNQSTLNISQSLKHSLPPILNICPSLTQCHHMAGFVIHMEYTVYCLSISLSLCNTSQRLQR